MIRFREIVSAFMVLFAVIDITGSIPIILDMKAKEGNSTLSETIISALIFLFYLWRVSLGLFSVDISSCRCRVAVDLCAGSGNDIWD